MKQIKFDYSTKNIPLPSHKDYILHLIRQIENLCKRMRWRAFLYLHPEAKVEQKETYGFWSRKAPPQISQLLSFEKRMQNFKHKIKFRKVNCAFQQKLLKDIRNKIDCAQVIIPADKTSNFYETNPCTYNKLLHDNITSSYQREDNSTPMNISKEAKDIATSLKLADRINVTAEKHAYITLKDHKANFETTPSCRLINPSKPELGKVSKHILDNINSVIASRLSLNQWKKHPSCYKLV